MHPPSRQPSRLGSSSASSTWEIVSARAAALSSWINQRSLQGLMPYDRRMLEAPKPFSALRERNGAVYEGLNFTASDYLGLSNHPLVKQAAAAALHRFGTHSAGSAALAGMNETSDMLARDLGRLLHLPHVALFPSGWMAGYGAMRALVRPGDVVLMDACVSSGIRSGASAASRRTFTFRHLDTDHARLYLRRLRAIDRNRPIFVATCTLFPIDGASADLASLHHLCEEYDACLIVDAAHDVGCIGPEGIGELELHALQGQVPVVIGSLSKSLASNGGFVAVRQPELCDYVRVGSPTHLFSSALAPAQVAAASQALAIVRSPEGAARRAALRRAVIALRAALVENGIEPGGNLGPVVVVPVGSEAVARHAVRLCSEQGVLLTSLETPLVSRGKSHLRLQLMAGHEPILMPEIAKKISNTIVEARSLASETSASRTLEHV